MKRAFYIPLAAVALLMASCTSFDADKDLSISSERAQIAHIIARNSDYAKQVMDSISAHPSNLSMIRSHKRIRMAMEKDSLLLVRMMENARLDTPWHKTFRAVLMNEKPMMGSCSCMDADDMPGMGGMQGMGSMGGMQGMGMGKMSGMQGMKGKMNKTGGMQMRKKDRMHCSMADHK